MVRFLFTLAFGLGLAAQAGEVRFQLTDAKGAPVGDAVVSLLPLDAPLPAAAAGAPREIAQREKEFRPYVTAIRVGTTVRFPNRDDVEHHVYSLSKATKFEFPLYKPGKAEEILFDQPGLVVVGCSIHDWMAAYVVVLETPWFAVTPANGAAALDNVPPGRYRAEIWQPRLREKIAQEITVVDGAAAPWRFTLTLKPDLRRRAPDGTGGGYR